MFEEEHHRRTQSSRQKPALPTISRQRPATVHHKKPQMLEPNTLSVCPMMSGNQHISRSASSSPRRSGPPELQRRESVLQMLNRIWKSDECSKRPPIEKKHALDVPQEPLSRQLSLSDTNVHPIRPSSSKLCLTTKQKRLLRTSFLAMNSGGTFLKLMEKIFRRLEARFPDMRSIFLTTAFVNSLAPPRGQTIPACRVKTELDHSRCLCGIFEKLIDNLENLDGELAEVRHFGEKHAQMAESGFDGGMIEEFGEEAMAIIGACDNIKYNHEIVKAWRLLLACVTDEMKVGYDRMSRINTRRNSINPPSSQPSPS
ncbi:unnamed protein product [Caenorhabditis angaria]|uniref:Globin family profile domain-containing protein n=1 Tax=Caenorhabditis angaria TaxID=860376 RepID=A0A9P1N0E4_9PELO|nr:unnamed protein product [Caenorhabditis angaria]